MDIWNNLLQGFITAGTPVNLLWALVSCTVGTAVGVLPDIGPFVAGTSCTQWVILMAPLNDFQAQQLFDVDTFFQVRTTGGGTVDLAPQAFNGATFSAQADTYTITNFSFSASGGASFTATPVPEPGAWVMLLAGLAGLAGVRGAGAQRRSPA